MSDPIIRKTGWSAEKPTVYHRGERDAIYAQSGKISYNITFPSLAQGLVPFLKQYGTLRYGKFSERVFKTRFNIVRRFFVNNLIRGNELGTDWSSYDLKSTAFYLYMCRVAQRERWVWPGLINRIGSNPELITGTSRLLASGMCHLDAVDTFMVLMFDSVDNDSTDQLSNPATINNDKELHDVLSLLFQIEQIQPVQCDLGIIVSPATGQPILNYINNGQHHQEVTDETQRLWNDYIAWWQKYPQPRIRIYTQWPEDITDVNNAWQIESFRKHVELTTTVTLPGHYERFLKRHHEANADNDIEHTLFVTRPGKIDIGDLLTWMTVENSAYIDNQGRFGLYSPNKPYKQQWIDISHIPYVN